MLNALVGGAPCEAVELILVGSTGIANGCETVCYEMVSCAETMQYLHDCGLTRLDRDGDGVPCEAICR